MGRGGRVIPEFTGQYAFLSNFYPSEIVTPDGWIWPTAEHLFQACKTWSPDDRRRVYAAASPGGAKRAGRRVALRPDWERVKKLIMLKTVLAKFEQNPELATLLDATYGEELVEGNDWNDMYWGQVDGQGANHLGQILMWVREVLRDDS
jgi:ribA/ribD-fused uncharacterized protein